VHDIRAISAEEGIRLLHELVALLRDSVEDGASIGFLLPFSLESNRAYWNDTLREVESGNRVLLVAQNNDTVVVPDYARLSDRSLHATVIFYKFIDR
jgi:hypothetical protein